jgi:hypothetical protein
MSINQPPETKLVAFAIQILDTNLASRPANVTDPKPTGRQIIEAAGGRPPDEFVVLEWRADGDLVEINIDETVELRRPGVERFIVARSDRTFRFEIDGRKFEWPEAAISRPVLLALSGQDPKAFSVWQELRNRPDQEILDGHPANLDEKGTERFYTVMTHTTEGSR